jgi:hypothetical protein
MGGKDGSQIYFGKPVIYDDSRAHYMYPNEARLRNMTYAMTIHYDIEVELVDILEEGENPKVVGGRDFEEEDFIEYDKFENYKVLQQMNKGGSIHDEEENKIGEKNEEDNYHQFFENLKTNSEGQEGGGPKRDGKAKEKKAAEEAAEKDNKNIVARKRQPKAQDLKLAPTDLTKIRENTAKSIGEKRFKNGKKDIARITQSRTFTIEKIYLGKFPIMVQSEFCILYDLPKEIRYSMGECRNDIGGYFIIDGKEKSIVPQEKFADNMLYIKKESDKYLYTANIRSVSENVAKPIRTLNVAIKAPGSRRSVPVRK